MTEHDPFERDLRHVLDELAAVPAPDALRARVAAIPHLEPSGARAGGISRFLTARGRAFRALSTLAAAAVILVAAALVVTTLPGGGATPGGDGGATLPTRPAATGSPASSAPAATAGTVVIVPTPLPSAAASSSPALPGTPSGFEAASVTFVSSEDGWALGSVSCGSSAPCAAIVKTTDGGRTWTQATAPQTALHRAPVQPGSGAGVSGIRFANASDGWAFGPDLWSTHDGGATWTQVTIPGMGAGTMVVALETSDGMVHAVAWNGSGSYRIASSPVGTDAWQLSSVQIPVGAGPVPQIQLVLSGSAGWAVEVDRVVVGGARLSGGTWRSWTPPCSNAMGPALLDAATPSDLVAECDGGIWGTPSDPLQNGQHLYVSTDGGLAFSRSTASVPFSNVDAIAEPTAGSIVLGGTRGQATSVGVIATSTDAGRTWASYDLPAGSVVQYIGFTTPAQGVAIVETGTATHLYMTYDGGTSWTETAVAGS